MRTTEFDLVVTVDPRTVGAAARSLEAAIGALTHAGYTVAWTPLLSAELAFGNAGDGVPRALDALGVSRVDPEARCRCRLLVGWSLLPFLRPLAEPLRIDAGRRIIRCDQPPIDLAGRACFALRSVLTQAEVALGGDVGIAATDASIATALERLVPAAKRLANWPHAASARLYRRGGGQARRVLLAGDGWRQQPDRARAAQAALEGRGIEAFRPLVGPAGPESLGLTVDLALLEPPPGLPGLLEPEIAEAIVDGIPCLGPSSYGGSLGDALTAVIDDAERPSPAAVEAAGEASAAGETLRSTLEPAATVALVEQLIGEPRPPETPRIALRRELRPDRAVAFMTSNGVGIGHLVRGLAIARRLDVAARPVFFTLSAAGHIAADCGWPVESFQHARTFGGDMSEWRHAMERRLGLFLAFHRPRVFVFDGNVPYRAVIETRNAFPDIAFLWVRRGMWRAHHDHRTNHQGAFDLVLEPGELAAAYDEGATARAGDALSVPPVSYLDRDELATRARARRELGIVDGHKAVLVQLGAGNNFDMGEARRAMIGAFAGRPGITLFELRWPISFLEHADRRVRTLSTFPMARLLRAFDVIVSACGYNGFHEILQARVPAVFVPNQNPEMDAQDARARWASDQGYGRWAFGSDGAAVVEAVEDLLQGGDAAARTALEGLAFANGAQQIARIVSELASAGRSIEVPPSSGLAQPVEPSGRRGASDVDHRRR